MHKLTIAVIAAGAISLGACTTTEAQEDTLESAGTGALIGGAVGAGAGAVIPGLSPIEGALVGAAVGGIAGAVWADRDQDGRADGYYYNGQYYEGRPPAPPPPPPPVQQPVYSGERG